MDRYFYLKNQQGKSSVIYRSISAFLILALSFTQIIPSSFAQSVSALNLPIPGTIVMTSEAFTPILLKGMTINPKDPFHFDFIVDSGNVDASAEDIKKESDRLVKYFMASMTVPKNDLWVNLSPYEKDRIIPDELGKTELGRDLLALDYILKQLSSSLMYPESEIGAKFWEKVYSQAHDKYGVTDIPMDTFNKVWILPESATVYEHGNSVYITQSHLKVMMDEEYLSEQRTVNSELKTASQSTVHSPLTTEIMKEIILPAIEKEVNTGKNFAALRQIYHSLILAKWYKETVRQSILSQVYIDQNKVRGLETGDPAMKEKIYERYMEAYKKGVYDYMKEEYDQLSQTVIPRQYFSGGFKDEDINIGRTDFAAVADGKVGDDFVVGVDVRAEGMERARSNIITSRGKAVVEDVVKTSQANLTLQKPVKDSAVLAEKLKSDIKKRIKIINDVNSSSIERGNAEKELTSILEIVKREINSIELLTNEELTRGRGIEIDNLIADIRYGRFELKGESIDVLKLGKEKGKEEIVKKIKNVKTLEEGERLIKSVIIGNIDRNIAEKLGYFHQTANAFILTPEGKILIQVRVPWKNFGLFESIYGGHLTSGNDHAKGISEELLQELGLIEEGKKEGESKLENAAHFSSFDVFEDSGSNKEVRSLFVYMLSKNEWKKIKGELKKLNRAKKQAIEALSNSGMNTSLKTMLVDYLVNPADFPHVPAQILEIVNRNDKTSQEMKDLLGYLKAEFVKALDADKPGLGEVWDVAEYSWEMLDNPSKIQTYTPDLLGPIMASSSVDHSLKSKVSNAIIDIKTRSQLTELFKKMKWWEDLSFFTEEEESLIFLYDFFENESEESIAKKGAEYQIKRNKCLELVRRREIEETRMINEIIVWVHSSPDNFEDEEVQVLKDWGDLHGSVGIIDRKIAEKLKLTFKSLDFFSAEDLDVYSHNIPEMPELSEEAHEKTKGYEAVQINLNQDGSFERINIAIPENTDYRGSLYQARKSEILDLEGMDYVIKIISDPGFAPMIERGYTLAKQRLGDLIAPCVLTKRILSSSNPLPSSFSIIQKRVRPAEELFYQYRNSDHAKAEELLKAMIEIDREIMRRGLLLIDWKIENFGVMDDGKVVLIDPSEVVELPTEEDFFRRGGVYYRFLNNFSSRSLNQWDAREYFINNMHGAKDYEPLDIHQALSGDYSARQKLISLGRELYTNYQGSHSLWVTDNLKEEDVWNLIKPLFNKEDSLHLSVITLQVNPKPKEYKLTEDRLISYQPREDRIIIQTIQKIDNELLWKFDPKLSATFVVRDSKFKLYPNKIVELTHILKIGLEWLLPTIKGNQVLQNYWSHILSKSENANIQIAVAPKGALPASITSLRIKRPNDGQIFIFFQYEFFKQLLTAYPEDYNNAQKWVLFAERFIKELGMPGLGHYSNEDIESMIRVIQNDALLQKFFGNEVITRMIGDGDTLEEQTISRRGITHKFFSRDINMTGGNMFGFERKEDQGHWFRSGYYYQDFLSQQIEGVNDLDILKLRIGQFLGSFVQVFDQGKDESMLVNHLSPAEINLLREKDETEGFIYKRPYDESRVRKQIEQIENVLLRQSDFLTPDEKQTVYQTEVQHLLAGPGTSSDTYMERPAYKALSIKRSQVLAKISTEIKRKSDEVIASLDNGNKNFKKEEIHILDGVGPKAKVIGRIDRKIAEKLGYAHETANIVLITPEGKVLLQLRNKENFDDHLAIYGGHLTVGESNETAVKDETLQETGLDKLDSDPVFVGEEAYDLEKDSNKERRYWYVKVLTEREFSRIKEKMETLERLKATMDRPAVKKDLFDQQKRLNDGTGEVIKIHTVSIQDLSNAQTKSYSTKPGDPATFEGSSVRFLTIHDNYQGKDVPIDAQFTPDSLDHLLSSRDLWDRIQSVARDEIEKSRTAVSKPLSNTQVRDFLRSLGLASNYITPDVIEKTKVWMQEGSQISLIFGPAYNYPETGDERLQDDDFRKSHEFISVGGLDEIYLMREKPEDSSMFARKQADVIKQFGVKEIFNTKELAGGWGSEVKPVYFENEKGEAWVLRRLNWSKDSLRYIVSLMRHLKENGMSIVPALHPLEGSQGAQANDFIVYDGDKGGYILERFISEGRTVNGNDSNPARFRALGKLAAEFNNASINFVPEGSKRWKSRRQIAVELQGAFDNFYRSIIAMQPVERGQAHNWFMDNMDFFRNQFELFSKNFPNENELVESPIHADIKAGNVKFDRNGNVSALIDFDFAQTDIRVLEINNLVMGKNNIFTPIPYSRSKFLEIMKAYNLNLETKLTDLEIRAAIEVIRVRFLEDISNRFIRKFRLPFNVFDYPENQYLGEADLQVFHQFSKDFDSEDKIRGFINEIQAQKTVDSIRIESARVMKFDSDDITVTDSDVRNSKMNVAGQIIIMDTDNVDVRVSVEKEMVERDLVDNKVSQEAKEGAGRKLEQFVDESPEKEDMLLAFNSIAGNFYAANSMVVIDGKLIRKPDGVKGVFQDKTGYVPLNGKFWFFSFDKGRKEMVEVEITNGELPAGFDYQNGVFGPALFVQGNNVVDGIEFNSQPEIKGNQVNFPRDKRMAMSAIGYTKDGKLVRATLIGDPNNNEKNEPTIDEFAEFLAKHNIENAILLGTTADVKTYIKEAPIPFTQAIERKGGYLGSIFPEGRPIATQIAVYKEKYPSARIKLVKPNLTAAVWTINPNEISPYLVIDDSLEGTFRLDRQTNTIYDGKGKKITFQEQRVTVALVEKLKKKFEQEHPELEIVGVTGNENVFYNKSVVSVVRDGSGQYRVYHALNEQVDQKRFYPMYVVDSEGNVTIEENVQIEMTGAQYGKILIDGKPKDIRWATGIQLIMDEKGFVTPGVNNALDYFYDDPKHLFVLPKIEIPGYMSDGLFFMADQILRNPKLIEEYFYDPSKRQKFDLTYSFTDSDGNIVKNTLTREQVESLLKAAGYSHDEFSFISEEGRDILIIRLRENGYPFHIVAETRDHRIKVIAMRGLKGGYGSNGATIREVAEWLKSEDVLRAGIVDQGTTVRLEIGDKAYVSANVIADDLQGPRASSIIIYARQNQNIVKDQVIDTDRFNKSIRSMLDILQPRDAFNPSQINDIVILGNYNLDTFRETLRIYRTNKDSRIIITGGRGRFIEDAIKIAENYGVTVQNKSDVSEAELIHQMMLKMIQSEEEFQDLRGALEEGKINFILEKKSANTPQNLQFYRQILEDEGRLNQENYDVLYIQTPHQQLRSKGTFDEVFPEANIKGVSHTIEFNREAISRYETAKELLGEAWRLIIYSKEKGNGTIELNKSYVGGLYGIPSEFWQSAVELFKGLYLGEQRILAKDIIAMMGNTRKNGRPLLFQDIKAAQKGGEDIDRFIDIIEQALTLPSVDQQKELVDLEINKAAQREGISLGDNTKVALFIGGLHIADGYYFKLVDAVLRNKTDLVYLPIPVGENDQEWLNVIRNQMMVNERIVSGVITRPWKEKFYENGDNKIGAVNYIIKNNGKLSRTATDGLAWLEGLKKDLGYDYDFRDKKIVVLGSGGAARELAEVLTAKGIERITFTDNELEKREALQVMIGSLGADYKPEFLAQDDMNLAQRFHEADIIINATGIGRQGTSGQSPVFAAYFENTKPDLIVSDLISDTDTQFLKDARTHGVRKTFFGRSMFIYGMIGFMQGWIKTLNPDDGITDETLFHQIASWLDNYNKAQPDDKDRAMLSSAVQEQIQNDKRFSRLYSFFKERNILFEPDKLLEIYKIHERNIQRAQFRPTSDIHKFPRYEIPLGKKIFLLNKKEEFKLDIEGWDLYTQKYGFDYTEEIRSDVLLSNLKQFLGMEDAFILHRVHVQSERADGMESITWSSHYGFLWETFELVVPEEAEDFVAFYLTVGDGPMKEALIPNVQKDLTQDELVELLKKKGVINPRVDRNFVLIFNTIRRNNVHLDPRALFRLWNRVVKGYRKSFRNPTGIISLGKSSSFEHDRYAVGKSYDRIISESFFLTFLRERIGLPSVYRRETASYYFGVPEGYGFVPDEGHYINQESEDFYVTSKEYDAVLRFSILAGEKMLRKVLSVNSTSSEEIDIQEMVESGIRLLGIDRDADMGNKESGFLLLDRLGLPYPAGITISAELVRKISRLPEEGRKIAMEYILKSLTKAGIDVEKEKLAVRSNPKQSMPGILDTITEVNGSSGSLGSAIEAVMGSWSKKKAVDFRKANGINDPYDLPIIIQSWKGGRASTGNYFEKGRDPKAPLYASGVFSTRDPDTNKNVLLGRYILNENGSKLMTGGGAGENVNEIAEIAPEIYQQLLEAREKLEAEAGPQEVEFAINNGKLYFMQTRRLTFSPSAEIAYIRELLATQKIAEARAIPLIEDIQKRLGMRQLYKVQAGVNLSPIARVKASTPGALQGRLVFSEKTARKYMDKGESIILVVNNDSYGNNQRLISLLSGYAKFGIIATSGNLSSHEAVLSRLAGTPLLIIPYGSDNEIQARFSNSFEKERMSLKYEGINTTIYEGDVVLIDGDNGFIYKESKENVLELNNVVLDASYGIDILELRKTFLAPYLNDDGSIKPEFTLQKLEKLNQIALEKFAALDKEGDRRAAFIANLEKHFLHELFMKKKESPDNALLTDVGGIDMNNIEVERQGQGRTIEFNPVQLDSIINENIQGFVPVIINVTPVNSILPILGLEPKKSKEEYKVSQLN